METKHTPGPWKIRTARNLTAICTPTGEMQLSLHGVLDGLKPVNIGLQEWQANARLITAAPDLLAALEDVCLQRDFPDSPKGRAAAKRGDPWVRARAAITKARREG